MPDYETLDAIADAYTPLLALIWLACALWPLFWWRWRLSTRRMALGIASVLPCYILMFAERALGLWPRLGLDYSTHSAVAIAFVAILCTLLPRLRLVWLASLFAYFALMRYQGYHTVADILSTSAVVAPVIIYVCIRFAAAVAPIRACRRTVRPGSQPTTSPSP